MFEDALIESGGKIRARGWSSGVAVLFNASVACVLIALPLLQPASLPRLALETLVAAPPPSASPVPPNLRHAPNIVPRPAMLLNPFAPPQQIPDQIRENDRVPPPTVVGNGPFSQQTGVFEGLPESIGRGVPPPVHVAPRQRRTAISSGVMAGRKLSGETPRYPAIAVAAHVEGTVVLAATISKAGTIENLRVVSGPALLTAAALDAVRAWRYRPYLLDGEPAEVETTVNVIFRLGL
jgi:periplasmic protein TonB